MGAPYARRSGFRGRIGVVAVGVSVLALLGVAGAGASLRSASRPAHAGKHAVKSVVVSTRTVDGLGTILVNAKGRTLYMFVPDRHKKVTCKGGCAVAWPPLKLPNGAKLVATHAAKAKLLGSDPDPAGGRVATYDGWPLYLWVGDRKPGQATGQALNANGGLWYVLSPTGKVITKRAATTESASANAPTPATTTTVAAPPPVTLTTTTTTASAPAASGGSSSCPGGQTVQEYLQSQGTAGDRDGDDSGGPDDSDGCL